jgi:hypothetical protein
MSEYLHILRNPRSEYAIRWLVEILQRAKRCEMWKCWETLGRWAVCGRTQASGSLLVGTVNLIFGYNWTARTPEGIRGRENKVLGS